MFWSSSWSVEFVILIITFWVTLYLYFTRKFNYWKDRNVPYIKPLPFFGNAFEIFTLRKSISILFRQVYESTTKPMMGFFICDEPCLLIRDLKLIKTFLIKDYGIWSNRTMTNNKKDDPIGSHMLFLIKTPDGWKDIRKKTSPMYSSGRLKLMYKLLREVGEEMIDYVEKEIKTNPIVDIRELSAKYTTDAITTTAFGINANCFKDENAEFRQTSRRMFNWSIPERAIATTCHFIAPSLVKLFKLKFVDAVSAKFLREVFWKTMLEREEKKFVRNDLLDVLIEMKNQQKISDPFKLEGDKLVAQALQFFIGGYETTSATLSFTLYELAVNPSIQKTVREEILRVKAKHGGFTYEAFQEMKYLDMCLKEGMRKYPSLPFLDRRCNEDYKIPGTDVVLEKGTAIFISNWALQMDPEYFPNPERYDPLRFTEENQKSQPAFTYMPFGDGPRNCIGARFAVLSASSCLAHLLSRFEVGLCDATNHPIKTDPKGFLLAPFKDILPLKVTPYHDLQEHVLNCN